MKRRKMSNKKKYEAPWCVKYIQEFLLSVLGWRMMIQIAMSVLHSIVFFSRRSIFSIMSFAGRASRRRRHSAAGGGSEVPGGNGGSANSEPMAARAVLCSQVSGLVKGTTYLWGIMENIVIVWPNFFGPLSSMVGSLSTGVFVPTWPTCAHLLIVMNLFRFILISFDWHDIFLNLIKHFLK